MTSSPLTRSCRIPAVLLDLFLAASFLKQNSSLKTLATKHQGRY
ncbi:MAG: hypothetical protein ACTS73_02450 [Arsenophonus sp. NEOnobi-MAG3]